MKTETKHTPGPWTIEDGLNHPATSIYAKGIEVAEVNADDSGKRENGFMPIAEGQANARLIAASPTMYEFLKSIENADTLEAAKGFARQAISKAEGK